MTISTVMENVVTWNRSPVGTIDTRLPNSRSYSSFQAIQSVSRSSDVLYRFPVGPSDHVT